MPNFLWKRLQNHKHTSLFYLIVNWISLGFELLVRFKEEWHLINLWALWNWQLSHLVDTNAAVLCFGSWGENPTKWQSLWISSKPHSHNSFNEAFGEKEKEMSACGCACPCMCETQKVKAGERERGGRKRRDGWGSRCGEWKAGCGKVERRWGGEHVWESGNRRWSCIPAAHLSLAQTPYPSSPAPFKQLNHGPNSLAAKQSTST